MGRPRKSDIEKKKVNKARYERFKAKQINVGEEVDRWLTVKRIVGTASDVELIKLLIDK